MKPHYLSNSGISFWDEEDDRVYVESGDPDDQTRLNKDQVIALRNWLNTWLDIHVFVVPPSA